MSDPVDQERLKRRTRRNWAVFIALATFVILVYAITMVKIELGHAG